MDGAVSVDSVAVGGGAGRLVVCTGGGAEEDAAPEIVTGTVDGGPAVPTFVTAIVVVLVDVEWVVLDATWVVGVVVSWTESS